jgi:hypothetical protein
LMSGRFSPEIKPLILETLRYVIESNGRALLEIECDYLSSYLQSSLNSIILQNAHSIPTLISGTLLKDTVVQLNVNVKCLLRDMMICHQVERCKNF